MLAFTDLEANDPKFDDVKILTRSQQGKLITTPIKVSIMNIDIYIYSKVIYPCLIKNYKETGYLKKYATIRRELGACVLGLGTRLSKNVAFTF